jgi:hypothetical protein
VVHRPSGPALPVYLDIVRKSGNPSRDFFTANGDANIGESARPRIGDVGWNR